MNIFPGGEITPSGYRVVSSTLLAVFHATGMVTTSVTAYFLPEWRHLALALTCYCIIPWILVLLYVLDKKNMSNYFWFPWGIGYSHGYEWTFIKALSMHDNRSPLNTVPIICQQQKDANLPPKKQDTLIKLEWITDWLLFFLRFFLYRLVPESPRWLAYKGRRKEAVDVLLKLSNDQLSGDVVDSFLADEKGPVKVLLLVENSTNLGSTKVGLRLWICCGTYCGPLSEWII